jgi:hypothetical protein
MKNGVITRKRGVIPGCRAPEAESHMAVEGLGHSWLEENFPPPSTPGSPNSQSKYVQTRRVTLRSPGDQRP